MQIVRILIAVVITGVIESKRPTTCRFSNECWYKDWCDKGTCKPMVAIGQPCKKNDECIHLSKCVPLGNGTCEETCRVDSDCLQFENGRKKYCTVGGLAATQKGRCEMKHERGYRCARGPECLGKMFCKNGQCSVAEEVVQCSLNCYGPDPRKPDHITPGSVVNVTYSCTFIRRREMGQAQLKGSVRLNHKQLLGKVNGISPQTLSGFLTKVARKGEFAMSLQAVMKRCNNLKERCAANRKCILYAGQ